MSAFAAAWPALCNAALHNCLGGIADQRVGRRTSGRGRALPKRPLVGVMPRDTKTEGTVPNDVRETAVVR